MRRPPHEGENPRPLHEKATTRSFRQLAKEREPTGVPSTPQERVELVFDKARQPLAIPELRRLGRGRVVVVAHDLIQVRRGRSRAARTCLMAGPWARQRASSVPTPEVVVSSSIR